MKRELQVFQGDLKDKELYLIEDALEYFRDFAGLTEESNKKINKLIQKLYSEFWEK